MLRIPADFGFQSATKAAKSSSFSTMSGCSRNGRRATSGSFFELTASTIPRCDSSLIATWKSTKASPSGPLPSVIPSTPSSPITPPQSVLSRSSTRQRRDSPSRAASTAAVWRASTGIACGP